MAGRDWNSGLRKASQPLVLFGGRGQGAAPGEAHLHALHWHQSVFSLVGRYEPAYLPSILLLLSGDIETNPGPYMCPTCIRPWTRRTGVSSVAGATRVGL